MENLFHLASLRLNKLTGFIFFNQSLNSSLLLPFWERSCRHWGRSNFLDRLNLILRRIYLELSNCSIFGQFRIMSSFWLFVKNVRRIDASLKNKLFALEESIFLPNVPEMQLSPKTFRFWSDRTVWWCDDYVLVCGTYDAYLTSITCMWGGVSGIFWSLPSSSELTLGQISRERNPLGVYRQKILHQWKGIRQNWLFVSKKDTIYTQNEIVQGCNLQVSEADS